MAETRSQPEQANVAGWAFSNHTYTACLCPIMLGKEAEGKGKQSGQVSSSSFPMALAAAEVLPPTRCSPAAEMGLWENTQST